jgi:hypothetical protein
MLKTSKKSKVKTFRKEYLFQKSLRFINIVMLMLFVSLKSIKFYQKCVKSKILRSLEKSSKYGKLEKKVVKVGNFPKIGTVRFF